MTGANLEYERKSWSTNELRCWKGLHEGLPWGAAGWLLLGLVSRVSCVAAGALDATLDARLPRC